MLPGLALVGLHLLLLVVSHRFEDNAVTVEKPILGFVALEVAAGAIYLLFARKPQEAGRRRGVMAVVFSIGAVLRLILMGSAPILEDDYYRYLWDGGVLANGFNPYSYSPEAVRHASSSSEGLPPRIRELAEESGPVIERVNHPHLRSMYPPVAQAAFALAHRICPWNLMAWKAVLLAFDLATFLLLARLIGWLGLPALFLAVYWWNPLLIKETYNSCHLDVIALPFVLGAVMAAAARRPFRMGVLLALGAGVKLWPLVLLPVLLRAAAPDLRRALVGLVSFGILTLALAWPVLSAGLGHTSGFVAYGTGWEMNDALFTVLSSGVKTTIAALGLDAEWGPLLARLVVAGLVLSFAVWTARKRIEGPLDLSRRCLSVLAALFLLSPTQFPWYSVWMLPFLTLGPRLSLLLLTPLLPLYYLRFHLKARDAVDLFDYGVVWIEFAPVWIALAIEWRVSRRQVNQYVPQEGGPR